MVSAEAALLIGGADEREGYFFQRVAGATRLSDGRIVVADGGSSEISFYDSLGTHLETVGGEGEGPGEFRGVMQIQRLPGDTLLILSYRPGLTWFSPEGDYLRSEPVNLNQVAQVPCRLGESNWFALRDGSILTVMEDNFGFDPCPPSPESPWRQTGLIARSTTFDGKFDTLGVLPATERNSPNYRAYGRSLVLAFGPERVFAGDTGGQEILVLSLKGDTLSSYPTPWEPVPIPPEAKREDVRRFTRPDGTVQVGNPYLYPDNYPLFGRILADEVGFLWVMAYPTLVEPVSSWALERVFGGVVEEGGARWRILGPNGRIVTEIRTPAGLFLLEIGKDYVLGVSKDELDVQAIQLHALVR
ncbi:MAG: hypothetical protein MUO50_11595 [Longimicrobiales bacterium]|nr:hypothetical protein [Longimicrobiales bacterium]